MVFRVMAGRRKDNPVVTLSAFFLAWVGMTLRPRGWSLNVGLDA